MIVLGIESTAHTFGVGIIDSEERKVLSNVRDTFKPPKGGFVPRDLSEHHAKVCYDVTQKALDEAKLSIKDIDRIAYSRGPGIGQALLIGSTFAKTLHIRHKIPVVGVNHCIAHLEIGRFLTECKDPVMLYVSGGNTQVISYEGKRYRVFGETMDIALGNLIDVFGREAGLPTPAGPIVEKLAKNGKYVELPYVVKGMDVSLAGMLTNLKDKLKRGYKVEDLAYSLQETAFAMLVEVTERAMAHTEKKEMLLTGGVAANKRLQEMSKIMCEERGARFYTIPLQYAGDNGAMIAVVGALAEPDNNFDIDPNWRTDQVKITWR